tara:strand:- start:951 stop:1847 length:897 start_codon:yes stop_codon:yes gene_type:complete
MIKKIYTLGTSFTAGGGFEWDSLSDNTIDKLKECYNHTSYPKNQFSYSWPGFLQRYLEDTSIEVVNLAENGYGNERIYRKVFDIVMDSNFVKSECLFLIEFSFMMRKEIFFKKLNDYIICNYHFTENELGEKICKVHDIAHNYKRDTVDKVNDIEKDKELINAFFNITMDDTNIIELINRNIVFFLSFLNNHGINYLVTSAPMIPPNSLITLPESKKVEYKRTNLNGTEVNTDFMEDFINEANLSISVETNGKYEDFHAGVTGNREIAKQIYNKLIDEKIISGTTLKEDWSIERRSLI